jgi:cysteinyl-tRNA synthetase
MSRFHAAMDDDFDVAAGLAVLFEIVREGNRRMDAGEEAGRWVAAYDEIAGVLGIAEPPVDLSDLAESLGTLAAWYDLDAGSPVESVEALVRARAAARSEQDWARSDEIRDALADFGIAIEDGPDGARWHRR